MSVAVTPPPGLLIRRQRRERMDWRRSHRAVREIARRILAGRIESRKVGIEQQSVDVEHDDQGRIALGGIESGTDIGTSGPSLPADGISGVTLASAARCSRVPAQPVHESNPIRIDSERASTAGLECDSVGKLCADWPTIQSATLHSASRGET